MRQHARDTRQHMRTLQPTAPEPRQPRFDFRHGLFAAAAATMPPLPLRASAAASLPPLIFACRRCPIAAC
jgi:hypothetical protein